MSSRINRTASSDWLLGSRSSQSTEKAQIRVEGTDPLYEELRVVNSLTDNNGNEVRLKKGADVDVTLEADQEATIPTNNNQ